DPARASEDPAEAGWDPARAGEDPAEAGWDPARAGEDPTGRARLPWRRPWTLLVRRNSHRGGLGSYGGRRGSYRSRRGSYGGGLRSYLASSPALSLLSPC